MTPKEHWDAVFKDGKEFTTLNDIFVQQEFFPRINYVSEKIQKLLDIGCGTGDTLLKMKRYGFDVKGIDASSEAVAKAIERTGLSDKDILIGDIDAGALDLFRGLQFDIVIVKLVFAFIFDKEKFLNEIKNLLKSDGKLFLMTPLLYPDVVYLKQGTRAIAVDAQTTEYLLRHTYSDVDLIHRDFIDDNGVLGYYLCKK